MSVPGPDMYATRLPEWVNTHVGMGYVLVAKNLLDFDFCEPEDLQGADEHVRWFHNFWWVRNEYTKPHLIAFFDDRDQAIRVGERLDDRLWWAVYDCRGVIQDGRY